MEKAECCNLYEILDIDPRSTKKEIKKQYIKLVKIYHPDISSNDTNTDHKIKQINDAFSVLYDDEARRQYDELLHFSPTSSFIELKHNYYNEVDNVKIKKFDKNDWDEIEKNINNIHGFSTSRKPQTLSSHNAADKIDTFTKNRLLEDEYLRKTHKIIPADVSNYADVFNSMFIKNNSFPDKKDKAKNVNNKDKSIQLFDDKISSIGNYSYIDRNMNNNISLVHTDDISNENFNDNFSDVNNCFKTFTIDIIDDHENVDVDYQSEITKYNELTKIYSGKVRNKIAMLK